MLAAILGWIATFLFTIALIPQIIKTIKTGTVEGVSSPLFIINFIANIVALVYAVLINQGPLVLKYVLALLLTGLYLGVYALTPKK